MAERRASHASRSRCALRRPVRWCGPSEPARATLVPHRARGSAPSASRPAWRARRQRLTLRRASGGQRRQVRPDGTQNGSASRAGRTLTKQVGAHAAEARRSQRCVREAKDRSRRGPGGQRCRASYGVGGSLLRGGGHDLAIGAEVAPTYGRQPFGPPPRLRTWRHPTGPGTSSPGGGARGSGGPGSPWRPSRPG